MDCAGCFLKTKATCLTVVCGFSTLQNSDKSNIEDEDVAS